MNEVIESDYNSIDIRLLWQEKSPAIGLSSFSKYSI